MGYKVGGDAFNPIARTSDSMKSWQVAMNAYEDRGEKTSLNRLAITWLEKGGEFELTT